MVEAVTDPSFQTLLDDEIQAALANHRVPAIAALNQIEGKVSESDPGWRASQDRHVNASVSYCHTALTGLPTRKLGLAPGRGRNFCGLA